MKRASPIFSRPEFSSEAEVHQRILSFARTMTPKQLFQVSIDAGIYTAEGELTPEYGGKPIANGKRRKPAAKKRLIARPF